MNSRATTASLQKARWIEAFRTEDGVFAVDARQRIIHWGASAQAILGHAPEDVLGRPCYEVMRGVDAGNFRFCRRSCPIMANALRGRPTPNYDVCTHTQSGVPVWVNMTILVPEGPAPKASYVVHLFRDVTERQRLQQAAQRAIADLREFITETPAEERASLPATPVPALTQREFQVLRLLACGVGTQRIAATLEVSPITARNHITNLVAKLGVENRLQAVVYASQHHLI
ncbi:MAG: PAS domain-containing protein [Chloroflexi bacterium]|nr:PAS domain-containing protein [Chloroflexota bacterium]